MSNSIIPDPIRRLPWQVLGPLSLLVLFGATVLYSAGGGKMWPWAGMHIVHFVVFLGLAIFVSYLPRDLFKRAAYPAYGILVVLLVLVEAVGRIGGGSQRWLNLGFMTLQPSELMKPVIVLVLAQFYDNLPSQMTRSWRALVPK